MRPIDADALIFTHEIARSLDDGHNWNELCITADEIADAPTIVQTEEFEWCTDCKEYDQEKHCCHRWSKQIRKTVAELEESYKPKRGEWKEIKRYWEINQWVYEIECSVCKERIKNPYEPYFCPNCGARMKGADDDKA